MDGDEQRLRRELAYYKRHLDDLAAQRIATEHHQWALHMQLRQKKQGFQLLSRLALSLGARSDPSALFAVAVLAINSALEMDRTLIFVPSAEVADGWVVQHCAGLSEDGGRRLAGLTFELPAEVTRGQGVVVGRSGAAPTFASTLREVCGLETFACVPVGGPSHLLGVLVAGRVPGPPSLVRALDHGDIDTFRAVSGLLQAIAQNTRLTLLEQTKRVEAEFYADVAHEFRTPLTLTLGPLAQILDGKWGEVSAPIRERLQIVERNQERLLVLINQILDLARLEAGAAELRAERIEDVNALVEDCVGHFRAAAEARGIELRVALAPEVAIEPLLADREKIERVLFNLLSNALKFTDRGSISVTTALVESSLRIAVTDTGIGIAEDDLPHIFDRFRRTERTGAAPAHGSGIGLALVKQIAVLHHGDVEVESRRGHGTRFVVELPWRSAEASPAAGPCRPASRSAVPAVVPVTVEQANRAAEAGFDPANPIVLYVEDDPDLRAYVQDSLAARFNLFVAGDGVEGLAAARRYRPDAIVTDQKMPRMGGRELLVALRGDEGLRDIPVVFLTAQFAAEGRIEALEAGADDYIGKPFHEAELVARIGNLIRARRHERELVELNTRLRLQVREQLARIVEAGELESFLPRPVLAALRQDSAPGLRPRPTKRHVTVLVTELSALASFGDRLDEPAIAALVDGHLDAVATVCAARGGIVDSLAGGRVSVLFGDGQEPAEDAAWSAAQAAQEIREEGMRLGADVRRRGLPGASQWGIGLASGVCTVGAFGGAQLRAYTAIGKPALRAARLLEAAHGQVLCDDATRSLLGQRVRVRPCTPRADVDGPHHEILSPSRALFVTERAPVERAAAPVATDRILRREGEYWTIVESGRVFRLADSKGMRALARLLAQPHVELHAMDLAGARMDTDEDAMSTAEIAELGLSAESGATTLGLDARARAAYRARLEALAEQASTAALLGDGSAVARLQAERDAIARELTTAFGMGGRPRKPGSATERCRVNVTRTLKAVLAKIARAHPELGRHLTANIHTGTFCSYDPPPGDHGRWSVTP